MNVSDSTFVVSAGAPAFEGTGAGGGLGNRVNATVLATDMKANLAARKASISQEVSNTSVGRILNITI